MNYLSGWRKSGAQAPPSPEIPHHFSGGSGGVSTRSLELVRYNNDTGKFELGEEALSVLRNTRGPVGVVAVAGRARQGKSYILNQLLGRSGGFTVGPTHRPCTKGLWMWSAPVQRTAPDGSNYSLVLLDTEGIDAYDQVRS
jgi:Guanylate-binding protein, N-terminal domain